MARKKASTKSWLIVALIAAILAVLSMLIFVFSQNNKISEMPHVDGSTITVEGEYVCLPKEGNGEQTLECALGIKTDDDVYYSLQFADSSQINYQTGKRLRVVGTFHDTKQDPYLSIGKIVVDESEQLD